MNQPDLEKLQKKYLESLSEKERKSYEIAKEHLGMSFQLNISNGFLKWLKKQATNS
jgi:hypothetical protein|uniref:Uncharacterized protein n=1 Tax=viral metagenome TaxID=1070528 RepID=A0A6C0JLA5_9ZZZZ